MALDEDDNQMTPGVTPDRGSDLDVLGPEILLVDDAPDTRLIMRRILQSEGLAVLEADSGVEALAILDREPTIKLILLDLVMPDVDGFEVLRRLRLRPSRPRVCVISAMGDSEAIEQAMALDADDYLVKPIFPKDVAHKVRSLLGREEPIDEFATVVARLDARMTAPDGKAVALTLTNVSEHGFDGIARTTAWPGEKCQLICPTLAKLTEMFGSFGVRIASETPLESGELAVTGAFIGLPESARRKLRILVQSGAHLADDSYLN